RDWFEARRPLVAINGSFFTPEYQATALLISDGVVNGASYSGFGGMLSVAPDGGVSLRALRDQPYDPAEPIEQALQSFPMLVFPGGQPAAIEDDGRRARRSVVAIDRAGRLLLLASPTSDFTPRHRHRAAAAADTPTRRTARYRCRSPASLGVGRAAL